MRDTKTRHPPFVTQGCHTEEKDLKIPKTQFQLLKEVILPENRSLKKLWKP